MDGYPRQIPMGENMADITREGDQTRWAIVYVVYCRLAPASGSFSQPWRLLAVSRSDAHVEGILQQLDKVCPGSKALVVLWGPWSGFSPAKRWGSEWFPKDWLAQMTQETDPNPIGNETLDVIGAWLQGDNPSPPTPLGIAWTPDEGGFINGQG